MSTPNRKRAWPKASGTYDNCQSPPYVFDALKLQIPKNWMIWEPAAGEGILADAIQAEGYDVHRTDITTGVNFLTLPIEDYQGEYANFFKKVAIVTNPPFSIKYDFMAKCYELGMPFALLMPVEMAGTAAFRDITYNINAPLIHIRYLLPRPAFKMPNMGWMGSGAQFPTAWYCHNIPGLRDGEFSYCQLDQEKIGTFHKQMKQAA
jgi:hypothetical protein